MRTAFRNVLRSAFLQLTAVLSAAIRTALCGIAQEFLFFCSTTSCLLCRKCFFWLCLFHKGRAFFFAPAAAVQRERLLRPAKKAIQLSALQCDSFRVSKFAIQTEKQDFF
ncbi:MAG TPA: hypothetical protein DHU76_00880 [Ruminococcus sp.]|jgi:hypothetical protein|nr:hypothetical protein [Ruminococcus sp.]HCY33712.1 hypothetical protein [Ruminococcus sp.]